MNSRVQTDSLSIDPAFEPPRDEVFNYLLERVLQGGLQMFFGSVPLARLVAFSDAFHPENHPRARGIVEQIMAEWRAGKFPYFWVCERGDSFIVSDDYFSLAAARRGSPDFVPCWILGRPVVQVKDLQGPLALEAVKKVFSGGR